MQRSVSMKLKPTKPMVRRSKKLSVRIEDSTMIKPAQKASPVELTPSIVDHSSPDVHVPEAEAIQADDLMRIDSFITKKQHENRGRSKA